MGSDNGGGVKPSEDKGKVQKPETPKDNTVLMVRMFPDGNIEFKSPLPPPQLNWILDVIKGTILPARPAPAKIVQPGLGVISKITKGAFGGGPKKRY